MIPEWVRGRDVNSDRIMVACWMRRQHGASSEADALIRSALSVPTITTRIEQQLEQVTELLTRYADCEDDPAWYAHVEEGIDRPGRGVSWDEWSASMCDQLLADARVLAEDMACRDGARGQRLAVAR